MYQIRTDTYCTLHMHVHIISIPCTKNLLNFTKERSATSALGHSLRDSDLEAFMRASVHSDTAKQHDKKWSEWLGFQRHINNSYDIYMESLTFTEQAHTLCTFIMYLLAKGSNASIVQKVFAAMKFKFTLEFQPTSMFDHPAVIMARKSSQPRGRVASMANQRKRRLPITFDMILWIKQEYTNKTLDQYMTYVGILLAFHFAFRASEYIFTRKNEHAIQCEDIEFLLADGRRVHPHLVALASAAVTAVLVAVRTSKASQCIGRYLYVTRATVGESELVDTLLMWAINSQQSPGQPFLSRLLNGRRKNLTNQMVTTAIKGMASSLGFDSGYFATHSLRIGGITTMRACKQDRGSTKRVAGLSEESNVDSIYTLNSPTDSGTLAHLEKMVASSVLNIEQVRLMCPVTASTNMVTKSLIP